MTLEEAGNVTNQDIADLYQAFQGIDTLHIMPQLPFSVDGTGHIGGVGIGHGLHHHRGIATDGDLLDLDADSGVTGHLVGTH